MSFLTTRVKRFSDGLRDLETKPAPRIVSARVIHTLVGARLTFRINLLPPIVKTRSPYKGRHELDYRRGRLHVFSIQKGERSPLDAVHDVLWRINFLFRRAPPLHRRETSKEMEIEYVGFSKKARLVDVGIGGESCGACGAIRRRNAIVSSSGGAPKQGVPLPSR